ncbi:MAG: cytochrome c-type biogenesis protein [Gammaproteobacteria bacterium]
MEKIAAAVAVISKVAVASAVAFAAIGAFAVFGGGIDPAAFANDSQRQSYDAAIRRLRCMVCQNQTLAESDAPLAKDMRDRAREMAKDGKNADEIADYIAARYGDFAVYRPPFDGRTAFLWLAPFALAGMALCFLPLIWRRMAAE